MFETKIKISVVMITYNHDEYIREAIEGVLMQKGNFDIKLIIADDNSPDKTEEIVLDIIKNHKNGHWINYVKHKENKGMMPNFIWALEQSKGKYIALCEGDDYWIDPLKLQKQVDFLEKNEGYGMVYTKSKIFIQSSQSFSKNDLGGKVLNRGILYDNPIPTLTVAFRHEIFKEIVEKSKNDNATWLMGDYPLWIRFYYHSKIHFLDEVTSVRRMLEDSASNFKDGHKRMVFIKNGIDMTLFYGIKLLTKEQYIDLINHKLKSYLHSSIIYDFKDFNKYYNEIKKYNELDKSIKAYLFILEKLKVKYLLLLAYKVLR